MHSEWDKGLIKYNYINQCLMPYRFMHDSYGYTTDYADAASLKASK